MLVGNPNGPEPTFCFQQMFPSAYIMYGALLTHVAECCRITTLGLKGCNSESFTGNFELEIFGRGSDSMLQICNNRPIKGKLPIPHGI